MGTERSLLHGTPRAVVLASLPVIIYKVRMNSRLSVFRKFGNRKSFRTLCPSCSEERSPMNRRVACLSVTQEDDAYIYYCHHCGDNGREWKNMKAATLNVEPEAILTGAAIAFFRGRGLSEETLRKYGVVSGSKFIRGVDSVTETVGFNYRNNGVPYATKWRAISAKGFSCDGAPQHFYLHDRVVSGEDIFICEGEIDALCLRQAGVENAISAPNGAPIKVSDGRIDPSEDRKFAFVWNSREVLAAAKRVYIGVDADDPGIALGEELARRIGRAKCWKVHWPEGCKDANDVLIKHGPDGITQAISVAEPWPVAGLYDAKHYFDKIESLWENGTARGLSTGFTEIDELFTIAPGQITVVTGVPSSGKSEFIDQIMVNTSLLHQIKWAVCSFENPQESHIVKFTEKYIGKPFFAGMKERMTIEEKNNGLEWVSENFLFMDNSDGEPASIESILDRASSAVMRMGIRGLVIDPYNFISRDTKISETEFVSDMLTKVRNWAKAHDAHVFFIAHPAKMLRIEGRVPIPGGYDISGSAHWVNKADFGLTVDRQKGPVEVVVWKCRFKWAGKQGKASLSYDLDTGKYFGSMSEPVKQVASFGPDGF